MIERRILLTVMVALLFLAAPLAAQTQTGKAYRVGVPFVNTRELLIPFIDALEKGFRDRGYVAGRNFTIDYRFAEGQAERLPALAAELAHLNPDVFVVPFDTTAELVRRVAPKSPIVITFAIDPVGAGLANSLARPGGTITGLTVNAGPEIMAKNLEILQETLPKGARLAVLFNAASQINVVSLQAVAKAAPKLGV